MSTTEDSPRTAQSVFRAASMVSFGVNILLFFVKLWVFIASGSKAIFASFIDSAVDLFSQVVLHGAEAKISRHNKNYPIGRTRLQSVAVCGIAVVMICASFEVIQFSGVELWEGFFPPHLIPIIEASDGMFFTLAFCTFLKFILWLYCNYMNRHVNSDTLAALAEDHINDVWSNTMAIISALCTLYFVGSWWTDPIGAIVIAAVIISRWSSMVREQIGKIVGHTAPQSFLDSLSQMAKQHDDRLDVDVIRAYHFGSAYNVEIEIVLPGNMTVKESHDVGLALQHKIEALDNVERCFVHIDYEKRDGLEHKVERQLVKGSKDQYGTFSV